MSKAEISPRFSVVTACYRVEPFLERFFGSLELQDVTDGELEIIAVDDGSDDGTLAALERCAAQSRFHVTVLHKSNGGQASARNLGMEHARGEWLTFTDPDDWLDRDYFQNIRAFIDQHPDVKQVSAQLVLMFETPDGDFVQREHPLDAMFGGDRLHNLNSQPEYFSGSAPASFVRTDLVKEFGLLFDVDIRPNFEDAHFVAKYLLSCPEPLLGLVGSSKYYYRKRNDGSSTLQTSLTNPTRYTVVPERAYLDLMAFGRERNGGTAPDWVQNLILYDLSWYFSAAEASSGAPTAAVGDVARLFLQHLSKLARELSPTVVRSFDVRPLNAKWRQILLHSFGEGDWSTDYVVLQRYDAGRDEVRIALRFVGTPPVLDVVSGTVAVDLSLAKIQALRYFDHDLLFEWGCWVPASDDLIITKQVESAGTKTNVRLEFRTSWRGPRTYRATSQQIRSIGTRSRATSGSRAGPNLLRKVRAVASNRDQRARAIRKYRAIARNVPVAAQLRRRRNAKRGVFNLGSSGHGRPARDASFAKAWVLIDRIHNANDSAEVLFRYLRTNRPDINAWFTVEESSRDYQRLVNDGFGDRVVPYGSTTWKLLMANAIIIVSSHADDPIFDPPELKGLKSPVWRRAFLQHGVIKDDLSGWLNPRRLDLFVVSTEDELRSIVGSDTSFTSYCYSERETKLTGMPRFDQLQRAEARRAAAGEPKDLVVVAPTWRHWLFQGLAPGSQRRELIEGFEESEFVKQWSGLVSDPGLLRACQDQGMKLVMLPHPNLERALGSLERLSGVEVVSYDLPDLHSMFARTSLLITDYSSVAFNIAYLESPTVYFQFDADLMFGGGHVGRKGYFEYDTMGFGPVTHDLRSAVDQTIRMVNRIGETGKAPEPWHTRIIDTFPFRDGRCSERVADEIVEILAGVDVARP